MMMMLVLVLMLIHFLNVFIVISRLLLLILLPTLLVVLGRLCLLLQVDVVLWILTCLWLRRLPCNWYRIDLSKVLVNQHRLLLRLVPVHGVTHQVSN